MLPRIVIRSQLGFIAIRTQPARLEGGPGAVELSMRGNAGASIEMTSELPRVRIDQKDAFASVGNKTQQREALDFYASSMQKGLQRIGAIAQEGLQMLHIEQGGNAIADIASRKGYKDAQLTIRSVERPEITAQPGSLQIKDASENVQTTIQHREDTTRFIQGSITITWGVEPSIEITVEPGAELQIPITSGVGMKLDEAV